MPAGPDGRLRPDLFLKVEQRPRFQDFARRGADPDQRQRSVTQNAVEIEIGPEFRRRERKHRAQERSSGQQIDPGRPEFPCAGAEEREPQPAPFDESVNLVQKRWQPLHLVHDDPASAVGRIA